MIARLVSLTPIDRIALKMLFGDTLKYVGLVIGLTFAAVLVVQQASIFNGYSSRTESWIRDTNTHDLWVMDEQILFSEDIKPMTQGALHRVRGVHGVEWAVPMYKSYLAARLPDGSRKLLRLIGIDDASLVGGPPLVLDGSIELLRKDRAILINERDRWEELAHGTPKAPLAVGDSISVNDNEAIVAGFYRAQPEFFWEPVAYTTFSRALSLAPPERKLTTFILVRVRGDTPVRTVQKNIQESLGLKALTQDEFAASTRDYILAQTGILVNFGITIALGVVIGVLVAGQTLYNFILENLRYLGALKAMGASNGKLIRMVVVQTLVVGLQSYGTGIGVATLTGFAFSGIGLAFQMTPGILIFGAAAILLCCLVAALLSIVRVLRLEPGVVFRG